MRVEYLCPNKRGDWQGMHRRYLTVFAVATFVVTVVFPFTAGAQETTAVSENGGAAETQVGAPQQPLVFAEDEQMDEAQAEAQAEAQPSGPLAGTGVGTLSTDPDREVEIITIPRTDCTFEEGASFVLQDEDGTQADFIDNDNVQISAVPEGLRVVSSAAGEEADIVPLNERGGDGVLDTGGLAIATSAGIECEAANPPPTDPPPDNPPPDNPPPDNPPPDNPPPDPTQEPEPQDEETGPLAGGTAIGNDVLVPGDVIRTLPDGTVVFGIDQITIETENCELTAEGNELTLTLSDRGVPFRIRDGDNADITMEEDGTIVASGIETLGESFPEDQRANPDRLIVPIPVDPENDQFPAAPNNIFPIISSTGVGGEGCRALLDDGGGDGDGDTDDGGIVDDDGSGGGAGADDADPRDGVIKGTIPDKDEVLPNTGGVPLVLGLAVLGLALVGVGFSALRLAIRRNT
jgi:hypothetical protein